MALIDIRSFWLRGERRWQRFWKRWNGKGLYSLKI